MAIERQELHCHNCDQYVQFDIDTDIDGRHVLNCPNCGHEHYRIVNRGIISDERWGSSNRYSVLPTITISSSSITSTDTSIYVGAIGSSATGTYIYMREAWANATTAG